MSEPSAESEDMRPCPKCHANMVLGTLLDRGQGNLRHAPLWILGTPQFSRWLGGLRTKGTPTFRVTTWRCIGCGYLESYALDPQPGG